MLRRTPLQSRSTYRGGGYRRLFLMPYSSVFFIIIDFELNNVLNETIEKNPDSMRVYSIFSTFFHVRQLMTKSHYSHESHKISQLSHHEKIEKPLIPCGFLPIISYNLQSLGEVRLMAAARLRVFPSCFL